HDVRELALARGPGGGEALVGHPSEQQRAGLAHLGELPGRLLGAGVVADPARVGVARLAARRLHHPVEGHEFRDDQRPHAFGPTTCTTMPDAKVVESSRRRWVVSRPSSSRWPPPATTGKTQKWYSSTRPARSS